MFGLATQFSKLVFSVLSSPSVPLEYTDVLAQKCVAFSHDALGFGLMFRVPHQQLQCLLIHFGEKGVDGPLYVMNGEQFGRNWM